MSQESKTNTLMHQLKIYFELVGEPFSAQVPFFFEGAQRRHNLETLKHLSIFGDMVLFLTGEKGAGKTHLLRQLQTESVNELQIILIDCDVALQAGHGRQVSIVQSCLHALQLPLKNESFEESSLRLLKACEHQQALDGRRTLVIFDSADKLSRQQVLALCSFCRGQPEESPLVVLFSGSHALLQNSKLGTNLEQNAWWHQIQLKPFASDEIVDYLNQALKAAGYNGTLELNEQQLTQLVQVGKGLPGRINKIFPSVLLEPGLLKLPKLHRKKMISFRVMAGLAGLLVLSFLIVPFQHGVFERLVPVFSLESSTEIEPELLAQDFSAEAEAKKQQAARLALLNAELEKQAFALPEKQDEALSDAASPPSTPVESADENTPTETVSEQDQEVETEKSDESVQVVSIEVAPEVTIVDHLDEAKNVKALGEAVVREDEPAARTRDAAFREKSWLQAQSRSAYIPQILGSFEEQTALKFIRQLGEQKFDIYYLETEHKGRPWFVVFYGVFSTKAEAQAAIRNAPERIKRQNPWLRSVSSVLDSYPKDKS